MTVRLSTGCRTDALEDLKSRYDGAVLRFFPADQPASADNDEGVDHLVEITVDGLAFTPGSQTNGLDFGDITNDAQFIQSILSKPAGVTWKGRGVRAGTIGWGRLYTNERITGASTTGSRIDGHASTASGDDFQVSTATVEVGVEVTVSAMNLRLKYQKNV